MAFTSSLARSVMSPQVRHKAVVAFFFYFSVNQAKSFFILEYYLLFFDTQFDLTRPYSGFMCCSVNLPTATSSSASWG